MKKFLKKTIAILLAFGMIFSEPLPAYSAVVVDKGSHADEASDKEVTGDELTNEELTDEETIEESPAAEDSAVYEALSEEAAAPSKEEGKFYGRVDEGQEEAQISENAEDEESLSEELPAKYDLRDSGYSTSVKDQDPWGTCWTFGTLASAESNAIKNGIAKRDVDYAERHLAYYVYKNYYEEDGKRKGINDPLGNTEGDYAVYEYESKNLYDAGGSENRAIFYLLGWRGPADESKFPYSDKADPAISMENIYNNSMAHLQNFGIINVKKQPLLVKKALMEHGVLAISYYDDDDSYGDNGAYYCTNGSISNNHTVALIGWDDNYTFGKNKKGEQPKNKGAWIVKNSWGTTASCLDKGYMYISYEDATFVNAYYQEYEKNDNYDNNYFYSGGTLYKTFDEANTVANIYEIKKGNQVLKACGIGIVDTDVNYELQIYKNPTDPTNPESGEKMLTTPQKGKTTFEGFYTVPLSSPQIFAKGDKVAVVFYLYKGDDIKASEPVKVYVDASDEVNPGEDEVQFYTKEERNQSLYSKKGRNSKGDFEGEWYDLIDKTPFPFTARIHAYTTNTSWALDYKDIDSVALELSTGESYQIKLAEGSTASFADLEIKSDKDSVATVSADGKISAVGAGEAYITVTDKKDEAKYQFISVNVKTDFKTAKLSFKDGKDSFAYTGKEIEPEVVVTVGDKQLVKDTDYELEYKNNMEAGSLTTTPSRYPCVVVTGKGSYKDAGSKKLAFTIEKKSLTASDVKVEPLYTKIYYSGKENKPGVDVIWDGGYLKKGRDYDLSYENNVEISTGSEAKPTVTIAGKGNYEGSRTVEFAIEKRPYSLWVDGCEDNKLYSRNIYYTGRKNEPRNLDVYWFDQKLTEGKDYTVKYDNNIDVYTDLSQSDAEKNAPAIIITGKGTYAACKLRVLFKIKPTDLGDTYTCNTVLAYKKGKIQKGKTKVNLVSDYSDVITLKEGRDYRIEYDKAYAVDENGEKIEDFKGTILSDIGTYKIPIQGIGNFSLDDGGCFFKEIIKEKKETINFDNISKAVFKYDGQVNPKIVKSWEGDKYYLSLKKCKLYYNINGVETELKEYKEGEKLGDCHYVANYKNNDGAGKATVTFIGINDFTGKLTRTFTIDKASFNKRDDIGGVYEIKGLEKSYTYLKNGVTPEIKVKYLLDDTTTVMEEGKDYTVKYVNNKECCDIKTLSENSASAPTVIVTGKGDYSGTLKATYAITKSSIFNLGGYSYATDIKYTGRPFKNMSKPAIYIYDDNGERLKAGTDYEKNVSYFYEEATEVTKKGSEAKISRAAGDKIEDTDIIPAGAKLYAVVTGKNNYTGTDAKAVSTVKISFSCYDSKNDISKSTVSLNDKGKDTVNRNIGRSFTLDEDEIDVKYNKAILDKDGSCYKCASVINDSGNGKVTIIIKGQGIYGGVEKFVIDTRPGKVK